MMTYNLVGERPEKTLYHYTSNSSFIKIIETSSLWATNILYLNDSTEFQYIYDIVKTVLPKYHTVASDNKAKKMMIDQISTTIKNVGNLRGKVESYVCSFSEEGDQLSQWRGYCPEGSGINIGFCPDYLWEISDSFKCRLVKCIYCIDEQIRIVETIIDKHLLKIEENLIHPNSSLISSVTLSFYRDIMEIAPTFKHHSFHEEKEWRLIVNASKAKEFGIEYRAGKSMIIPYVCIVFGENLDIKIDNIVIGPCPHSDLSLVSVNSFLELKKVGFNHIQTSEVPYRAW